MIENMWHLSFGVYLNSFNIIVSEWIHSSLWLNKMSSCTTTHVCRASGLERWMDLWLKALATFLSQGSIAMKRH